MCKRRFGEGSSSHGGDSKPRGKAPQKKDDNMSCPIDKDTCWRGGKTCKNPEEVHLAHVDDEEPTLTRNDVGELSESRRS